MTGGLLDRLIARAEAELTALETDPAASDRSARMAEVRERLTRLGELRADALRRPRPHPAADPDGVRRVDPLTASPG